MGVKLFSHFAFPTACIRFLVSPYAYQGDGAAQVSVLLQPTSPF